ncbi:MAG: DNA primase [Campylobacter sp.]
MIEQKSIEHLRNSIDIADVVGAYVSLKRSGSSLVGLCPFHDDKSPSMHVSTSRGLYHCFACGAGGDAIKFVMEYEKLSYPQAIEKLASMFGIELEYSNEKTQKKDNSLKEILELLNNYYKTELFNPANAAALQYLKERALSPAMIEKFELGWAPPSQNTINLLQKNEIEAIKAFNAGVIKNGERGVYASFSNRITFPIYNHIGSIVGFGGRTISDHPAKYINSPQSEIFDKSRVLYGYDKARAAIFKSGEVIICEGYMDCIMLHQAGFFNAVAVLGTALTPKHLPLLKKENIKVILSFDSDTAGQNAALRSAELLSRSSIDGKVVLIEGGKDPAELVAANRQSELASLYKGGVELVEFVLRKKAAAMSTHTPMDKVKALDVFREYLGALRPEIISFYEPLVAQILGINPHDFSLRKNVKIPQNNQNWSINNNFRSFKPRNSKFKAPQDEIPNPQAYIQNTNKRDILSLSVLKNILLNNEYKKIALPLLNAQMFKDLSYYNAFVNGDEGVLRSLELDESLELYDAKQFKSALNRLVCSFLESEKNRIANSSEDNKAAKIRELTIAINKLRKEI